MPLTDVVRWAVASSLTVVLAWASVSDLRARRIPNWTVLVTLALFVPIALSSPGGWVVYALLGGVIALAATFALYTTGVIGAGDSKLFAAVALHVGLGHLALLAILTALAGGVVAVASLGLRPYRAMALMTLKGKGDFGRGVPYGVAISVATLIIVWAPRFGVNLP